MSVELLGRVRTWLYAAQRATAAGNALRRLRTRSGEAAWLRSRCSWCSAAVARPKPSALAGSLPVCNSAKRNASRLAP